MPRVLSSSSTPPYWLRFHAPPLRAWLAGAMLRAVASSRPIASSAAEVMLEVGAFTTMTPARVAAGTSTLSRPTPARAITFSRRATVIASASISVADRMRTASASMSAGSSAARSAPSQCRTSKSGPRASIVAGESSSAMRTTGLVTRRSFGREVGREEFRGAVGGLPGTPTMWRPTSLRSIREGARQRRRSPPNVSIDIRTMISSATTTIITPAMTAGRIRDSTSRTPTTIAPTTSSQDCQAGRSCLVGGGTRKV